MSPHPDDFPRDPFAVDLGIVEALNRLLETAAPTPLAGAAATAPIGAAFDAVIGWLIIGLTASPWLSAAALILLALWNGGRRAALVVAATTATLGLLSPGLWDAAMVTLAFVLPVVALAVIVGFPIGILIARNRLARAVVRPWLDVFQSVSPIFYIPPLVWLIGVGTAGAVILTFIAVLPIVIRFVDLGLRNLDPELPDAARAVGFSALQAIVVIEVPAAAATIRTGIGQAISMSLWMTAIVSVVTAQGLGGKAAQAIARGDPGSLAVAVAAIALLAIALDRALQPPIER